METDGLRYSTPCAKCGKDILFSQERVSTNRDGVTSYYHAYCYQGNDHAKRTASDVGSRDSRDRK
jgi:hypothetical protein